MTTPRQTRKPRQSQTGKPLEPLIIGLNDKSIHVRDIALEQLWKLGSAALPALPAIAALIGDPDEFIAHKAFRLFQRLTPELLERKPDLSIRIATPESRLAAVEELIRLLPSFPPPTQSARSGSPASITEDRMPASASPPSNALPSQYPGMWIAWNDDDSAVVAATNTFPEMLERVAELGLSNPTIEIAPGIHPSVAASQFDLLPDESPSIEIDVRKTIPDADEWLDTPNTRIGGKKPRDLIGTPREERVRDIIRSIRGGITT